MPGIQPLRVGILAVLLGAMLLFACLAGKPTVAHSSAPCKQRIVHLAGEPPQVPLELYLWRVRARGIGCLPAIRIARRYTKGRDTGRWVCGSTHFEMGCRRGAASIHLRALHPIGRACGRLGFEANTDNVATGIRAARVTCATARALVRAVYEGTGRSGFYCRSTEYQPLGLPYVHWVCRRGEQQVRWLKT